MLQNKKKLGEENARRVVVTIKAAKLKIEGIEETIVATSVCDSKSVSFLSSLHKEIK